MVFFYFFFFIFTIKRYEESDQLKLKASDVGY